MQGLLSGLARGVNRTCQGKLWRDRYHMRPLGTPTEVRRAIIYVLGNGSKHAATTDMVDPLSSAAWFDGFAERGPLRSDAPPVARPRGWLLARGWLERGGGPLRPEELPAPA
jgi:hypothetical protein